MKRLHKLFTVTLALVALLFVVNAANAQALTGTKTVGAGKDYVTIQAAIADLNSEGVGAGGVVFNVDADHTETFSSPTAGRITVTGNIDDPIIFQKDGVGANPKITAGVGTTTDRDGIIVIGGGDYITFDGIDVQERAANATNTTRMEWGYAILKKDATDAAKNITIKNCEVTLNKANTSSRGIYINNHIATSTTQLVIEGVAGIHENITIQNNRVENANRGIYANGNATYTDDNLQITGNNISNWTQYGIFIEQQNASLLIDNTVTNGSHTTGTIYGIYLNSIASPRIEGNRISGVSTTVSVHGISLNSTASPRIARNRISGIETTGTSATVRGINVTAGIDTATIVNNAVANLHAPNSNSNSAVFGISVTSIAQLYHNTVHLNCVSSGTSAFLSAAVYIHINHNVVLRNNIFYNNSTVGTIVGLRISSNSQPFPNYDAASNNNLFYAGTGENSYISFATGSIKYANLAAHKAIGGGTRESESISGELHFLNITDATNSDFLHINPAVASIAESAGAKITGIDDDIDSIGIRATYPLDDQTRSWGIAPDLGIAEFDGMREPVITSFTPTSAGLGLIVTITGKNLIGATAVKFGGTDAASFTVENETTITAEVANGTTGDVTVTTIAGTATLEGFSFVTTPIIAGFTPASASPGETVTITGTNFTGATAVKFGGIDAASFTVVNTTTITAEVANGTTGSVTVTTENGTATSGSEFTFTPPVPTIVSFTPESVAQGMTVTITGTNFIEITAVKFGGTDAASFNVVNTTTIIAVVAGGTTGSVSVTNLSGTATLEGFTHENILSGTYSVGAGKDFNTITDAIALLNIATLDGSVVFNVDADHTETFASPTAGRITATGTETNTIIFQKSGEGANPLITAATGANTLDGIIVIAGGDYITFDGIDVQNSSNTNNNTRMEWGYAILKASETDAAKNIVIKNCVVTLDKANTSSRGIYINNHIATSNTQLTIADVAGIHENIIIQNNTIENSYQGIYASGYTDAAYLDTNLQITGNTVNNWTQYGIYIERQNTPFLINNKITNGSHTGDLHGMSLSNVASPRIERNRISDISTTGNSSVRGIAVSAGIETAMIVNNAVANLHAPNSNSSSAVYGISVVSIAELYHNTVHLNCVSGQSSFLSAAVYVNVNNNYILRNNIFYNNSTVGNAIAFRVSGASLTSYDMASNNNLFYAGTRDGSSYIYYYTGSNYSTLLTAYKTKMGGTRDSKSVSGELHFLNTTDATDPDFLHINPVITNIAESAGEKIPGIDDDINNIGIRATYPLDGQTNGWGTAPDLGAAEFDGTRLVLNGVYTIGAGKDYESIAQAIADLNALPQTGPVTFNVDAGHTETFPTATTGHIFATGTVTDTIVFQKSGEGANPLITNVSGAISGQNGRDGIIVINGGDYITFDGIDVQDDSESDTPAATARMEWGYAILKKDATDAAKNITIKNCSINLYNKTHPHTRGIYIANHTAASTSGLTVTDVSGRHENILLQNNTVRNAYRGIYVSGRADSAYYDANVQITDNTIDNFGEMGIYMQNQNGLLVKGNTVNDGASGTHTYGIGVSSAWGTPVIENNTVSGLSSSSYTVYGVYVRYTDAPVVSGNSVSGLDGTGNNPVYGIYGFGTVSKNKVWDVSNSGKSQAFGIRLIGASTVSNNLVAGIHTTDSTAANGIYATSDSGAAILLYHNTVYINNTGSPGASNALYAAANTLLTLRNNIFYNATTESVDTVRAFYRRSDTIPDLSNYQSASNNNLFYADTPSGKNLVFFDGINSSQTLAEFQAFLNDTREEQSLSEQLTFINVDNGNHPDFLRPARGNYKLGANIAGFEDDFEGTPRGIPTDIGAYEGAEAGRWIGVASTDWNNTQNWDNDTVPVGTVDLIDVDSLAAHSPVLMVNITAGDLILPSGKTFDINGNVLTITNDIIGGGFLKGSETSSLILNVAKTNFLLDFEAGTAQLQALTINPGPENDSVILNKSLVVNDLTLSEDKILDINGNTLTINGEIIGNGKLKGSATSSLVINGTGNGLPLNFASGAQLKDLTINRGTTPASGSVILNSPLAIKGIVTATNGTLNANGNLTLISDTNNTASVAKINLANADITGDVTVQRFIPAGTRRYRTLSPSVQNFEFNQMQDDIMISGSGGTTNGFDESPTNGATIYTYQENNDDAGRGWKAIASPSQTLAEGEGVIVFIRGSRDLEGQFIQPFPIPDEITIDYTGELNKGIYSPTLTYTNTGSPLADGWNLIGNPYACPIDWNNVTRNASVSPFYWVLDPVSGSYVAGLGDTLIASGQAFFVQAFDASPSVTFSEDSKSPQAQAPAGFFKSGKQAITAKMTRDALNSDVLTLEFKQASNVNYNPQEDAVKFTNSVINFAVLTNHDSILLQYSRQPFAADTIRLYANATNGNYTLDFSNLHTINNEYNIFLHDGFTNSIQDLRANAAYNFDITSNANSKGNNRFKIVFSEANPLPAKLVAFTGKIANKDAVLNWTTAYEKNTNRFVVERLEAGSELWEVVRSIAAKGNTNTASNYNFTDKNAFLTSASTLYYRLRIIDKDGGEELSNTIVLKPEITNLKSEIVVYPNPARNEITIKGIAANSTVEIFDIAGKKVLSAENIQNAEQVEISSLKAGIYFVKVNGETVKLIIE